ncbi:hypothetical protein [Tissierella creatinophila]|uniref:Uncharacterized protein n=1 Tax=Tissierella creatinophila DSM 6911 TaxID=1123403 RepID=A0A1U7M8C1_TISCR|nr:hypothetical protein [Tissierella creatinophila]OLS03500.1 hypothetical protein TICRE_04940 [Tissierella creatinophila DSM 6911]
MKEGKMNEYIRWGLLLNGLTIGAKQFIVIPDAIVCFIVGIGISLLIFGIYETNHDITKFKKWKRSILKNFGKLRGWKK